jgi:PiT family inorganic phosphate transporter
MSVNDPVWIVLVATVLLALAFDVINGFHDAANSIATVVSTRVLSPFAAVIWAAFFNFAAMLVFAPRVADTVSKIVKVLPNSTAYVYVVLAGLVGAIAWDLITWWLGLPTSSSHSIIGGISGAGIAHGGWSALRWEKLTGTLAFIPLAPLIGGAVGLTIIYGIYRVFWDFHPGRVDRLFRRGQLVSAALYSLNHGGNDAQKTMGIIIALLVAGGVLSPTTQLSLTDWSTLWIIMSCHAAMGIGTALGGWRIVKTLGMRITKLRPVGGFAAESAGAITLFMATHYGIPVSTTHTITGAIVGVGSVHRLSAVRWGIALRIVWAWVLTIPAAGLMAAVTLWVLRVLLHF